MKTTSPRKRQARRVKQKTPPLHAGTLAAKLVRIGNSRGVRLPKAVIEQAGLTDDVQISVTGDSIIIRPADRPNPRAGWEEQIKKALAEHGDDIEEWRD